MTGNDILVHVKDWVLTKPREIPPDPDCWDWDYESDQPAKWTPAGQLRFLEWWQEGRCGICSEKVTLVLDHDHGTGLVRGYLCVGCNNREGTSTNPTDVYARWRAVPAAALLGLRIPYAVAGRGRIVPPDPDHVGGPRFLPSHAPHVHGWPIPTKREPTRQIDKQFKTRYVVAVDAEEAAQIEAANEVRRLMPGARIETRRWRGGDPTPIIGPLVELQAAVFTAAQAGVDMTRWPRAHVPVRCPTRERLQPEPIRLSL